MSANRYAPPKSEVEVPEEDLSESVPDEVLKKIKHAWTAGLISAALTLLMTLLAIFGIKMLGFDAWMLLDVALILGLTYGIYRKSRVCAVLMLVYFIISKILLFAQTGKPNGIVMAVIFLYYYAQGVAGTFAYHKYVQEAGANQQAVS
jgi:serine/threonine-protein kinase